MASDSWKAMQHRVATLETQAEAALRTNHYSAVARKKDDELRENVDAVGRFWAAVPMGTITATKPVFSYGTFAFDASYPTGGEAFSTTAVPSVQDVIMWPKAAGGTPYTFEYDPGGTMKAFSGGTEVANGTDLSALSSVPYLLIGSARDDSEFYRAPGAVRVLKAEMQVGGAWTADSSNYWTATVRLRKSGQTTGELVGEAYSLNDRSLSVQDPVELYDDVQGLAMAEDERLAVYLAETGTPAPLEDLVLWVLTQRIAR